MKEEEGVFMEVREGNEGGVEGGGEREEEKGGGVTDRLAREREGDDGVRQIIEEVGV